jgi:hypothetical protein
MQYRSDNDRGRARDTNRHRYRNTDSINKNQDRHTGGYRDACRDSDIITGKKKRTHEHREGYGYRDRCRIVNANRIGCSVQQHLPPSATSAPAALKTLLPPQTQIKKRKKTNAEKVAQRKRAKQI